MRLLFIALTVLTLFACNKTNGLTPEEYIEENNIDAVELSEGVYIHYIKKVDGPRPTLDDRIAARYKGYLTDGKVFDSSDSSSFLLRGVIRGWQIAFREMGVGTEAQLIIPHEAGYGSRESATIPEYSTLVFDVTFLDVIK